MEGSQDTMKCVHTARSPNHDSSVQNLNTGTVTALYYATPISETDPTAGNLTNDASDGLDSVYHLLKSSSYVSMFKCCTIKPILGSIPRK